MENRARRCLQTKGNIAQVSLLICIKHLKLYFRTNKSEDSRTKNFIQYDEYFISLAKYQAALEAMESDAEAVPVTEL